MLGTRHQASDFRKIQTSFDRKAGAWRLKPEACRGFTLIELMVVLAIVVITSLILLVSAQKFNSAILLRSLAYQVGLSIREAQLYGVAVHQAPVSAACSVGDPSIYCSSFGVHFSTPPASQFVIFPDINNNGVYDAGEPAPTKTYSTQYGFTISSICVVGGTGAMQCGVESGASCPDSSMWPPGAVSPCTIPTGAQKITSLDIVFKRPNPDARITINGDQSTKYTNALIVVSAPGGAMRAISVSLTGQIVVEGGGN